MFTCCVNNRLWITTVLVSNPAMQVHTGSIRSPLQSPYRFDVASGEDCQCITNIQEVRAITHQTLTMSRSGEYDSPDLTSVTTKSMLYNKQVSTISKSTVMYDGKTSEGPAGLEDPKDQSLKDLHLRFWGCTCRSKPSHIGCLSLTEKAAGLDFYR